jgi:hypothetical protein
LANEGNGYRVFKLQKSWFIGLPDKNIFLEQANYTSKITFQTLLFLGENE